MQMRAGDPVPMSLPLHSLLQAPARLGVSILPPLRSPSHIVAPPNLSFPLEVSWSQGMAVSPGQLSLPTAVCAPGWAVPVPCHTETHSTGPMLWRHRSPAEATSSQGHTQAPGTRGVPRSHPNCCAQVGRKLCQGPWRWEAMGGDRHPSVLCRVSLVPVPTAGHCSGGTVLRLHGLGGRSPLRPQSCTPSAPYALRISTDQA